MKSTNIFDSVLIKMFWSFIQQISYLQRMKRVLSRRKTEGLSGLVNYLKKISRRKNLDSNTIYFMTPIIRNILKKNNNQYPQHSKQLIQKIVTEMQQKQKFTINDLLKLLCSSGPRQFWMNKFTFDQFFDQIIKKPRTSDYNKLYYVLRIPTLWQIISSSLFYQGVLYSDVNYTGGPVTNLTEITKPKLYFISYEELGPKGFEFCQSLLRYLENYEAENAGVRQKISHCINSMKKYMKSIPSQEEQFCEVNQKQNLKNQNLQIISLSQLQYQEVQIGNNFKVRSSNPFLFFTRVEAQIVSSNLESCEFQTQLDDEIYSIQFVQKYW